MRLFCALLLGKGGSIAKKQMIAYQLGGSKGSALHKLAIVNKLKEFKEVILNDSEHFIFLDYNQKT